MADRSPKKPAGKKLGKSIKEKRAAKKERREERGRKSDRMELGR
jgi:hypothetical protein